ncbi:MAG: ribonuclease HI [Gammaproteobacteria bacterium]|nr:ribonuclease HI [Gammaproteobacteria bacterium]MXW07205.1 ribonuclease HI [Gammaproteobacteria bacterium]MYC26312.1 ribonuclease HI [Gammaproteobacteria bacterium]
MRTCVIYTDGACLGNPGPGGWAALVRVGTESTTLSGGDPSTTNNRMEMQAVIASLSHLTEQFEIQLYTDSRYVINGINDWIDTWSMNNWRTANRKPVKNKELWQELYARTQGHSITWHWVRGHSGDQFNELVDRLAREEAFKYQIRSDV